jgi:AraC-like DNA-binding protein
MLNDIATAKQAIAALGNRNVTPSRSANDIRKALRGAIKMNLPMSLSDVARSLGYSTTERLYLADRKLCHAIAARYRKSGRSHWWRKPGATRICEGPRLKQTLEESLESKDPVSVHHIAARLGYSNDGYIQQKFPELCAAIGRKIAERKQASLEAMHQALEKAIEEDPAPTLIELARRLGCTTSTTLRSYHPELCDRILARYRTQLEERRSSLRKAAELSFDETPAPTVRTVCERLGITAWFMNQYFPDVGHRIARQHLRWKAADIARRRGQLVEIVLEIAKELHSEGLYPSVPRITDRVPPGYRCEWATLNAAVRQAQIVLGISIGNR